MAGTLITWDRAGVRPRGGVGGLAGVCALDRDSSAAGVRDRAGVFALDGPADFERNLTVAGVFGAGILDLERSVTGARVFDTELLLSTTSSGVFALRAATWDVGVFVWGAKLVPLDVDTNDVWDFDLDMAVDFDGPGTGVALLEVEGVFDLLLFLAFIRAFTPFKGALAAGVDANI